MTQFFLIFVLTIFITRIFLYVKPTPAPMIQGLRIHHWMFGVLLIPVALTLDSMPLYAIGLGLFIDELTYLLMGGKTHEDNYSKASLLGTVLFVVVIFLLQEHILYFFEVL